MVCLVEASGDRLGVYLKYDRVEVEVEGVVNAFRFEQPEEDTQA